MEVKVKKLDSRAKLPTKATEGSACYDVYALEDTFLVSRWSTLVGTGLSVEVPKGYMLDIRPRSGLARSGIVVNNSPGTLDSDYRGELKIMLYNQSDVGRWVKAGDRIAQVRLVEILDIEWVEGELSETERGIGGFGSTGR